jgi:hypothetical protein
MKKIYMFVLFLQIFMTFNVFYPSSGCDFRLIYDVYVTLQASFLELRPVDYCSRIWIKTVD